MLRFVPPLDKVLWVEGRISEERDDEEQLLRILGPYVKTPEDGELKPRDFYIMVANRIREAYQNPEAVAFQEARAARGRAKI